MNHRDYSRYYERLEVTRDVAVEPLLYGEHMKPTLRSLVDESGYRQDHIAKKMEVPEASLSRWLNGGAQLPVTQAKPLADTIGIALETVVLAAARTWKTARAA